MNHRTCFSKRERERERGEGGYFCTTLRLPIRQTDTCTDGQTDINVAVVPDGLAGSLFLQCDVVVVRACINSSIRLDWLQYFRGFSSCSCCGEHIRNRRSFISLIFRFYFIICRWIGLPSFITMTDDTASFFSSYTPMRTTEKSIWDMDELYDRNATSKPI